MKKQNTSETTKTRFRTYKLGRGSKSQWQNVDTSLRNFLQIILYFKNMSPKYKLLKKKLKQKANHG